jgi:hypothetical protein
MTVGKRVIVEGRLQGMNWKVHCRGAGLRTSSPDAVLFEIRDISILDVSEDLPDGIYELDYEGSLNVRARR